MKCEFQPRLDFLFVVLRFVYTLNMTRILLSALQSSGSPRYARDDSKNARHCEGAKRPRNDNCVMLRVREI